VKAVVQRVLDASVRVGQGLYGRIDRGLLVYLGVARDDTERDADKLAEKIAHLRIFSDERGKMNLSIGDLKAPVGVLPAAGALPAVESLPSVGVLTSAGVLTSVGVLVVSQFTLLADVRKGRRPFYGNAADGPAARSLYEYFTRKIGEQGLDCRTGVFQAHMELRYTNDGPVTIIIDSKEL
jgi:D-tyrosyl-tRNA(Tyr) deacylase